MSSGVPLAGNHPAIDQGGNAVGQAKHRIHVVLDQQQGGLAAQALQQATMRSDSSGPMPAMGSSSNSSLGRGQRQAHFQLALLTVRHSAPARRSRRRPGPPARPPRRPWHSARCSCRAARQTLKLWPACACTASATLSSTDRRGKMLVIWYERTSPWRHAAVHGHVGDVHAIKHDAPGAGHQRARDLVDQGGFAGPIGANQRVDFARQHVQVGVVGGQQAAKALDQAIDLQQGYASRGPPHACGDPASFFHRRLSRPLGASSTTTSSTAPRPNCQWMV